MAKDMNLCLFTGRLGKDPELRYTQSGTAVCNISIAVGGSRKNGEQWEDTTEWVNLVLWGRTAEVAGEYLTKGSHIRVTSECQTRKWQDKSGNDRYTTEFNVREMQMLGGKSGGGQGGNSAPAPAAAPADEGGFDDDIPFAPVMDPV